MYRIAICDDDKNFTAEFHHNMKKILASKNITAQIEEFHNTAGFLEKMEKGNTFDLIFLDILLENENGYSFAKKLRRKNSSIDIIFITTTEDYAIAGYDVSPLLYMIKPVMEPKLAYAFELFLKKRLPNRIVLDLSGEILTLNLADLLYCEVYGHRTTLHLTSGEKKEIRYSLNRLEQQLPSTLFARSHQSYLVNMEHIDSIVRYRLTLNTGLALPVSQSRYLGLQNSFLLYASRQKIRI